VAAILASHLPLGINAPLVVNPEFLREGSAVYDTFHPDRAVIGAWDASAAEEVAALYAPLRCPVLLTDPVSAQFTKYASNAFLALKISFINAVANLAETVQADIEEVATGMGIKVSYVERKPDGCYAYWRAGTSEIVVWAGIANGDRRAVAHSLAHELGHARLGHGTEDAGDVKRPDKEAAAESFAALLCARAGIETSEMSALYVSDWRRGQGIEAPRTTAVFRSALQAYDEYVAEVEGAD
jgi:hypothetical protein